MTEMCVLRAWIIETINGKQTLKSNERLSIINSIYSNSLKNSHAVPNLCDIFSSTKHKKRMISEGSCDRKLSIARRNKLHFKYIQIENSNFK